MRFKKNIKPSSGLNSLDFIPVVNLVLLSMAFFILAWALITQPSVKVNLPFASTSQMAGSGAVELIITSENRILFDSVFIEAESLKKLLVQASLRRQSVLIKASKKASLEHVAMVLDICRQAGIRYTNIASD
jgi:biopolymer transport protein ExbD